MTDHTAQNQSVNVFEKLIRVTIVVLITAVIAGCARPVGDFGRAKPAVLHDQIMPTLGKLRAIMFEEPVSTLNLTDEEVEMHDRAWRFLIAPHARDWIFNILVELQRTRLITEHEILGKYQRYYETLRSEQYRSSRVRYSRVGSDVETDITMMPDTLLTICAVEEIDRRRAAATQSLLTEVDGIQRENVAARKTENLAYIDWFVRSARLRYNAYSFALEQLLIETPHEQARLIDEKLSRFAILVEQAERRDFCGVFGNGAQMTIPKTPIKSRMSNRPFTPEPTFRK